MRKNFLGVMLVLLFALTACGSTNKDISTDDSTQAGAEYVGEWKANTIASHFDNVITYDVDVLELCDDKSGSYKDEKATWEYAEDTNTILLTLTATQQILELEISEVDGVTILKFFDDVYYQAENFVAKEQAYMGIDGTLYNTINEVEITLDNWQQYFEIVEKTEWLKNAFDEAENLRISTCIQLKEEYKDTIDYMNTEIAFEVTATKKLVGVDFELQNETYSYNDVVWEEYTDEYKTTGLITNDVVEVFGCCDGYLTKDGAKVTNIEILENISVSRIQGKLFLYE